MKKSSTIFAACLTLTACVQAEPIVSEFNGDSVQIVTNQLDDIDYQRSSALAEANRICGKVGKRAEYASTRQDQYNYQNYNLYLCL